MSERDDEDRADARATEEAHAAQRRLAFMYSATDALLRAGSDPSSILERLVQIVVPDLSDVALAWLGEGEGRARCVAAAHFDPVRAQALSPRVGAEVRGLTDAAGLGRALATGQSELMPYVGRTFLGAGGQGMEHQRELLESLALRSMMIVPLRTQSGVAGAVLLGTSQSERFYGPEDVNFAEDLCQRAALVIENAQAREKAEAAARMRENLLAMVSHDLRNPLNAIVVSASLIQRAVDDPRLLRWLSGIHQNAQRMNALIQDLLDMASIEAGSLRLDVAKTTVAQILEETEQSFGTLAQSRGIALEVVADAPEQELSCDPHRVGQVLSNLLGNALKFTPPGGTVTVRVSPDPQGVVMGVEDTGPGIPPENLKKIFDPYWQGGGRQGGVGLGLSIARGIVEAHGGSLWAESEPGHGATIRFTLPQVALPNHGNGAS